MANVGSNGPAKGLVHETINIAVRGVTVPVYSTCSQEAGKFRDWQLWSSDI
jgi:hypothetical protein